MEKHNLYFSHPIIKCNSIGMKFIEKIKKIIRNNFDFNELPHSSDREKIYYNDTNNAKKADILVVILPRNNCGSIGVGMEIQAHIQSKTFISSKVIVFTNEYVNKISLMLYTCDLVRIQHVKNNGSLEMVINNELLSLGLKVKQ